MSRSLWGITLAVIIASNAWSQIIIDDHDFAESDWIAEIIVDTTPSMASTITIAQVADGNPGYAQAVELVFPYVNNGAAQHFFSMLSFEPGLLQPAWLTGSVVHASLDAWFDWQTGGTPGVQVCLSFKQQNRVYLSGFGENLIYFPHSWWYQSWAIDLGDLVCQNCEVNVPLDLSESGAPIQIGYLVGTGAGVGPSSVISTRILIDNFRVQFEGDGSCITSDLVPPYGLLDFFDVQAFLALFAAGDTDADLTLDGEFDFFDVQVFLQSFASGCR